MERKMDIVSEVASKFAIGQTPRVAMRLETASATPQFLEFVEECSFWCPLIPCHGGPPPVH